MSNVLLEATIALLVLMFFMWAAAIWASVQDEYEDSQAQKELKPDSPQHNLKNIPPQDEFEDQSPPSELRNVTRILRIKAGKHGEGVGAGHHL